MGTARDFLKGFGLGLGRIAMTRLVFTGARVAGVIGFVSLIWWKPHIFGHPYAPFIGIGLVIAAGIAWRVWSWKRVGRASGSGGWRGLGVNQNHGSHIPD